MSEQVVILALAFITGCSLALSIWFVRVAYHDAIDALENIGEISSRLDAIEARAECPLGEAVRKEDEAWDGYCESPAEIIARLDEAETVIQKVCKVRDEWQQHIDDVYAGRPTSTEVGYGVAVNALNAALDGAR